MLKDLCQAFATILFCEEFAFLVGIDIDSCFRKSTAHNKVKRHTNSLNPQPQPFADLHIEQRKRQRNPQASFQYAVEKTVLWIIVIDAVAPKMFLLKQDAIER